MNANELIKYFENYDYCEGDVKNLVELCRQQQAELEALKAELDEANQRYWNNK